MKIVRSFSFAKQLIIYLLLVLIITFIFISWTLTNSVQQFINTNAHFQTQLFVENVRNTFEKEILQIEAIPDKIIQLHHIPIFQQLTTIPTMLMKTYPQLAGCSIHYNTASNDTTKHTHIVAIRQTNDSVCLMTPRHCSFRPPAAKQILRQNQQGGFWIYSNLNQTKTIAFCHPISTIFTPYHAYLKLDFPLKVITDIICNCKVDKYGYLFILDSLGNYLIPPFQHKHQNLQPLSTFLPNDSSNSLKQKITNGETGSSTYYANETKYFVYYSPTPCIPWRLGVVCPYNETFTSSHKLYWIIFLCLGGGLLFLFAGTINIVHLLSYPLRQLAYSARQIADGKFNAEIPQSKSSNEIKELYDSFRYMQHSIINYIEKLKISTAEKEQRNSEMLLARKIQQRFLSPSVSLPSNIQLAAELRQSQEVGGDLYEFLYLDNRLYFAIGDVSGKGTPAALYMVSISILFRYIASCHCSTATICNIINKQMCVDNGDDMYVTMFMGILDVNTGIMTYTNAGHPYPLIVHENGETNFLSNYPDVPIGILEDHNFTEHTYTIHKNNSLLFYTDGITDAENPTGQFYGKEKLINCIEKVSSLSPQLIIHTILADITQHIDTRKQSDDLTLLLIRYNDIP